MLLHAGLRSSDPYSSPLIDLAYFNDPEGADMRTLREGLRIVRSIAQQQPLAGYISQASICKEA